MRFRAIARIGGAFALAASCIVGSATTAAATTSGPIAGYWSVDAAGSVRPAGDAPVLPDLRGVRLNAPVVGIAATPDGHGYWLAAADGGVFSFGDARFYGSAGNLHLNAPIVGIARTATGRGYWLVASDGGVFTYGDARFFGSAGNLHLNAPVVGMAPAPRGYRLAASDGGVFTYGGASFRGSAGNLHLNAPIVGIASVAILGTESSVYDGYRLAAADGGVFTFGGAAYSGRGAVGSPISAIATTPFGGYVLQHAVGGSVATFGNASSCLTELPPRPDPTQPRFVGVAPAYNPTAGAVVEGALATVNCGAIGGLTGTFHPPARWHVDVDPANPRFTACSTIVGPVGPGAPSLRGPQYDFTAPGSIQMRSTQTAGHATFDVIVFGFGCSVIASSSFFVSQSLPFTTTKLGDTAVFSSPSPITIHASGTCATQVRADNDGRLIQKKTGSSYTMTVAAGQYWLSNTKGCTVSVN